MSGIQRVLMPILTSIAITADSSATTQSTQSEQETRAILEESRSQQSKRYSGYISTYSANDECFLEEISEDKYKGYCFHDANNNEFYDDGEQIFGAVTGSRHEIN